MDPVLNTLKQLTTPSSTLEILSILAPGPFQLTEISRLVIHPTCTNLGGGYTTNTVNACVFAPNSSTDCSTWMQPSTQCGFQFQGKTLQGCTVNGYPVTNLTSQQTCVPSSTPELKVLDTGKGDPSWTKC